VTHCNTLQHTATHCNTLQHNAIFSRCFCLTSLASPPRKNKTLQHTTTRCKHCNTLQHAATRCNTLQHTATHCNILSLWLPLIFWLATCKKNSSFGPFQYTWRQPRQPWRKSSLVCLILLSLHKRHAVWSKPPLVLNLSLVSLILLSLDKRDAVWTEPLLVLSLV